MEEKRFGLSKGNGRKKVWLKGNGRKKVWLKGNGRGGKKYILG